MTSPFPALRAFVIGPIGDRDAADGSPTRVAYEEGVQILEEVIAPACQAFGLEPVRADSIARTGEIPEQVFRLIRDSAVVIADLTGANPNVMYELGLRHTTGKLTIQLGERDRLPFDVAAIRTIMFKRTNSGLVEARKSLARALGAGLDSGGDPVTATRVWFEVPVALEAVAAQTLQSNSSNEDEEDEPGFLEMLVEMEDGIQGLSQTLGAATTVTEEISQVFVDAARQVQEVDARGGGAAGRLIVADRTAALLEESANRLQIAAGDYGQTVARVEPGLRYLIVRLSEEPDQLKEAPDFPSQIRALIEAAKTTVEGAQAFRRTALDMGGASRSLRKTSARLAKAFQAMSDVSDRVVGWSKWTDQLP